MKLLALLLVLFSAREARSQYLLGIKRDWNSYLAHSACLNEARDSLTLELKDGKMSVAVDTVSHLSYRDRKSWKPYLLTAGLVGASAYTYFHFASQDDAWFTAEGKARFAGVFWGGVALLVGAGAKEMLETDMLIKPTLGVMNIGAMVACEF